MGGPNKNLENVVQEAATVSEDQWEWSSLSYHGGISSPQPLG